MLCIQPTGGERQHCQGGFTVRAEPQAWLGLSTHLCNQLVASLSPLSFVGIRQIL